MAHQLIDIESVDVAVNKILKYMGEEKMDGSVLNHNEWENRTHCHWNLTAEKHD